MSPPPDSPNHRRIREALALAALGLWFLLAHWQIARAILRGVVYWASFGRAGGPGRDIPWAEEPVAFSLALGTWILVGPVFLVGILAFLWIQRNDRY